MPNPPPGGDMNMPAPPAFGKPSDNFFFSRINHNVFLFLAVAFFSLLLRIRNRWQQSEKEKLTAELSYLKAQINPHFLFNSLNSIYSLALQKADSAPEAVQKLSSMMRYVLTDANNDFVPLQKELDHIRYYIELQRLRFGKDLPLNCTITGDEKNKKIAPLILISFIENAFKYGINAEEDAEIKIEINVYEKSLGLFVSNNMVTVNVSEEEKSGIGLDNTKSRLGLVYPDAYELDIKETAKQYIVNLSIKLN
jgi:LytS/YehU family sensor histidine kinase